MTGRTRDGGGVSQSSANRQNEYFVPRDGIDREVITADICRYLGNDALVRPGTYQDPQTGQMMQGYRVTAYRALTSAMIQDLKNDSARWEAERRSHSGNSGARYSESSSRFSSGSGQAQYETSAPPYPLGSSRDSYDVVPRYPGNDAPGYSGAIPPSGSGSGYQYDNRQQSRYSNAAYPQGQTYPSQSQDRYSGQAAGGAYPPPSAYGTPMYSQDAGGPPYVNVGANIREAAPYQGHQDPRTAGGAYPAPGQGGVYYSGQYQGAHGAQPLDPMYGRGNTYPPSTGADYSGQPVYNTYDPSQYETANQSSLPRATTSSPLNTQAQTGSSGSHSSHRHRDRDTRDGSYSKSDRHRRP